MTKEEHIERHKLLHNHLDELIADWITATPQATLSRGTIMNLMMWSSAQIDDPDGEHTS